MTVRITEVCDHRTTIICGALFIGWKTATARKVTVALLLGKKSGILTQEFMKKSFFCCIFCKKQLFSFPENVIISLYRRTRFFRCARMYGTNRDPLHKTDEKE